MDYLEKLKESSQAKAFHKGSVVIQEGAHDSTMFIVLLGELAVYKNHRKYDEVLVGKLSAGDFFGEMSLFLMEPRSATIVALENSLVLEMTSANAIEIIETYPEVPYNMMKALCKRLQNLNNRVSIRYPNASGKGK